MAGGELSAGPSSGRYETSAANTPRDAFRSSGPEPATSSCTPTNEPHAEGPTNEATEPKRPATAAARTRSPGPRVVRAVETNERAGARPATGDPAIPSAICTIGGGVAAASVSPRGKVGGCTRQLVVAEQYLNHSLVVPPSPREQTIADDDRRWRRLSTAEGTGTEAGLPAEGISAGRNHGKGNCRPRTSPAGSSRGNTPRGHSPVAAAGGSIWRSSVPGGDCSRGDLSRVGLSSRPLKSRRTEAASVANGGLSGGRWYGSTPRRPREPVVVASPERERSPQCGAAQGGTSPVTQDPAPAAKAGTLRKEHCAAAPVCGGGGTPGVDAIGEVGYTVSSAAAAPGDGNACYCCCTDSGCDDAGTKGCRQPRAASSRSERFLGSQSCDTAGVKSSAVRAPATIPKLQLDLLE